MKTRKHFIRKYELLVRCIQTNLEFFMRNFNAARKAVASLYIDAEPDYKLIVSS